MPNIAQPLAPHKSQVDTSGERDLMLNALRAATAGARLAACELDSIGVALRHKTIGCTGALQWLRDEGLLDWVHFGPVSG